MDVNTALSVIIITKNLAWNIARLIESVLRETPAGTQIIVVDSASTDRTVEIARMYGVTVVQLSPHQRLTAAAGRFVGQQHARGKYLFFLDGDMALRPGWLPLGLAALQRDPKLAAVCGTLTDVDPVPVEDGELAHRPARAAALTAADASVELPAIDAVAHGGGAALYRAEALTQAGGWNPALYSDEEPELCLRIRANGGWIGRMRVPMVLHFSRPYTSISNDFARAKRKLYLGYGQNLRNKLGTPHFWPYVQERGNHGLSFLLIGALGVCAIIAGLATGTWLLLAAWLLLQALIIVAYTLKKRSAYLGIGAYIHRILCADGTLRGFFLDSLDHLRGYSPRFKVID
jgi:glycosyltransferase involved in cell wall biosynthesis